MKDYTQEELIAILGEYTKKGFGLWVRLKDDFPICLVGVANAETGQFIAAYFPCARNSKRYQIAFATIREMEKVEDGAETTTFRLARLADHGTQSGS